MLAIGIILLLVGVPVLIFFGNGACLVLGGIFLGCDLIIENMEPKYKRTCMYCRLWVDKDDVFCGHCGKRLLLKCPACGKMHDGRQRFCPSCGMSLANLCPNCHSQLKSGEKFCKKCGTQVWQ